MISSGPYITDARFLVFGPIASPSLLLRYLWGAITTVIIARAELGAMISSNNRSNISCSYTCRSSTLNLASPAKLGE